MKSASKEISKKQLLSIKTIEKALTRWKNSELRKIRSDASAARRKLDAAYARHTAFLSINPLEAVEALGTNETLLAFMPNRHRPKDSGTRVTQKERMVPILKALRRDQKLFTISDIEHLDHHLNYQSIRNTLRQLIDQGILYTHTKGHGHGKASLYGFTKHRLSPLQTLVGVKSKVEPKNDQ